MTILGCPPALLRRRPHHRGRAPAVHGHVLAQGAGPAVIFHSLDFVVFFLVTAVVYWRLPHRAQNVLLLVASYVFYGCDSPVVPRPSSRRRPSWITGRARDGGRRPDQRLASRRVGLRQTSGCSALQVLQFLRGRHAVAPRRLRLECVVPTLALMLPVGISFYTFRNCRTRSTSTGARCAPGATSSTSPSSSVSSRSSSPGPIERAARLLPQIERRARLVVGTGCEDACLILWGYFKKLVIADNVGRHRQHGLRAAGARAFRCCGRASSRSRSRSTRTSRPTATSRAAPRAGSGSI